MTAFQFRAASDCRRSSRSHQTAGLHDGLDKGFRSVTPRTRAALSPGASAPGTAGYSRPRGSAGFARLLGNEEGEPLTARVDRQAVRHHRSTRGDSLNRLGETVGSGFEAPGWTGTGERAFRGRIWVGFRVIVEPRWNPKAHANKCRFSITLISFEKMVLPVRIELTASPLPRCSSSLHSPFCFIALGVSLVVSCTGDVRKRARISA